MKARPKKVVTLAETSAESTGFMAFLNKYANSISTVVLIAAAVFLFVRWRMVSAEKARGELAGLLESAQGRVMALRTGQFQLPQSPSSGDIMKAIQDTRGQASSAIASLISSTDADNTTRAQAFVLRGDMYWYLANLPPLAGSESEPSLRLPESTDDLLKSATDSYQQVLRDSGFSDQHEQLDAAHLGLAAIAENRGDWDTAKKELDAVVNDPNAVAVLKTNAQQQETMLPDLQKPVYLSPPTGEPSTQPTTRAVVPLGPDFSGMIPTTAASTNPAMAAPASQPATKPIVH